MKVILLNLFLILNILNFSQVHADNNPIIKFITSNNDTIIIYSSDIITVDTLNSLIFLKENIVLNIKNHEEIINNCYFLDKNSNWVIVQIVDVRSSRRVPPYRYIFTNRKSLFIYSDNAILYDGIFK